ncbi:hypothetical protein BZA77DRAFT_309940 [Pyronema omphalodes]|nr:hypothetical protein BZA77DRAFT_309940 [Pyronema omphalodes]
MSLSIFKTAFGQALRRRPLSAHALAGFNGSVLDSTVSPYCRHGDGCTAAPLHTSTKRHTSETKPPIKSRRNAEATRGQKTAEKRALALRWWLLKQHAQRKTRHVRLRRPQAPGKLKTWAEEETFILKSYPWKRLPRKYRNLVFKRIVSPKQRALPPDPDPALKVRQYFRSPAPKLIDLLRETCLDIKGYYPGKTDLSYVDPLTPVAERPTRERPLFIASHRWARYSLKEITTAFIYYCRSIGGFPGKLSSSPTRLWAPHRSRRLQAIKDRMVMAKVFTPWTKSYLKSRGCTPGDVMRWAWLVTSENAAVVERKLKLMAQESPEASKSLPLFVVMSILQRNFIRRSTLQLLIPIVENLYSKTNQVRIQDDKTTVVLGVRLIRHFRKTWPSGLTWVAKLISDNFYTTATTEPLPRWVTGTFNRLLNLFSIPPTEGPFKNVSTLQKCQFTLVHRMVELKVPFLREGYRAMISVQLAHHKTAEEAAKARNMKSSWPPFYTEPHGWTAHHRKAHEGFVTRAGLIVGQMIEDGYPLLDWEKEALILSGKDTDNTPTIQTRSFWNKGKSSTKECSVDSAQIWAARVRATRTLDEAWYNFQQCKAQSGAPPDEVVWMEMFEKVIWAEKLRKKLDKEQRIERSIDENSPISVTHYQIRHNELKNHDYIPGDGKELVPSDLNPKNRPYTAEPPPSLDELFGSMIRDGIKPRSRLVSMLLSETSRPWSFAMSVLNHWDKEMTKKIIAPNQRLRKNFNLQPLQPSAPPEPTTEINAQVLRALLTFLCNSHFRYRARTLLLAHQPQDSRTWNVVMESFLNFDYKDHQPWHPQTIDCLIIIWQLFKQMMKTTDPNPETLRLLATAAERSLSTEVTWDGVRPIEKLIPIFFKSIGMEDEDAIPPVQPEPAFLHVFMRVLGLMRRYDEMEMVINFLARKKVQLTEERKGRQVLVACRVFLEGAGYGVPEWDFEISRRGWETLERLTPVVNEAWGGWGEESDVVMYLVLGRLVRGQRLVEQQQEELVEL